tara:strand:- start:514 stop:738 length:225 start_codon:yes stop_codon:yes gene_type:complete
MRETSTLNYEDALMKLREEYEPSDSDIKTDNVKSFFSKREEEPEVSDDLDSFVKQAYAAIREDNNYMMQELRKE